MDKTELKIKLYNVYIDFLKDKGQNEPNISTLLKEKETKFTGLLNQLDDLIKKRMTEKENPVNDTKPLTKEIEVLQNDIKELEKASPKDDEKIISELEKVLQLSETDMTIFFRELALVKKEHSPGCGIAIINDAFYRPSAIKKDVLKAWEHWFKKYIDRFSNCIYNSNSRRYRYRR